MYIATVIPIQKGLQKDYLSYFSAALIPLGTIVTIPIRSKTVEAIIVSVEDARDLKSDLKNAEYQLKKIIGVKGPSPFTSHFFTACERLKEYNVANTGSIINSFFPRAFMENIQELKSEKQELIPMEHTENIKHEKLIFQAVREDRMSWYRTMVREAFAKKQSVFITVPTRYDIDQWKAALIKGIEQYVFAFHSDMPKKSLIATYNKAVSETHPILIIGTGMFLSIPRTDIRTIIVEHESSDSYKQWGRPYADTRTFAEVLSSLQKSKIIFADTLLRPETLYRHEEGNLGEVAPPLFRLPQVERQLVVDMKEETDTTGKKKFTVFSEKAKNMLTYAQEHNESVFLFTIRKGLAGVTVCNDCAHTLLCPDCSTPIVLYGSKQRTAIKNTETRIFMCNKCGRKETTETRCPNCTSWNLTPLGIGTDRVYEETKTLFPKATIIQIDKEATPSDGAARKAIELFYKTPGSILIGTEMAFSYLREKITHSALISLDGLLSIPSFNITQKILHCIEKLHAITERTVILQTRLLENPILKYITSGNVLPLYREDLNERRAFGYPPFKRLIKITFSGNARDTEKARNYLEKILAPYDPQIFSAFISKVKGEYITNTVIKVAPALWPIPTSQEKNPSRELYEHLALLPPSFAINVDPEDLL